MQTFHVFTDKKETKYIKLQEMSSELIKIAFDLIAGCLRKQMFKKFKRYNLQISVLLCNFAKQHQLITQI